MGVLFESLMLFRMFTWFNDALACTQHLTHSVHDPRGNFLLSEPKKANEGGESGSLLPAARVVNEEAWVRLTPILEHSNQTAVSKFRGDLLFVDETETDAFECSADYEFQVIDNQRATDGD